jgi:hypothetical protein
MHEAAVNVQEHSQSPPQKIPEHAAAEAESISSITGVSPATTPRPSHRITFSRDLLSGP